MNDEIIKLCAKSIESGRGVVLHTASGPLAVAVTEIVEARTIVGRNQEWDTLAIALDAVIAVSSNDSL